MMIPSSICRLFPKPVPNYGFVALDGNSYLSANVFLLREMCARIGLVTDRGLAGNIRLHFRSGYYF